MGKPTEEELRRALEAAGKMRELGKDPYHVAKALLNANYRLRLMEKVLKAADRFVAQGQSVQAHRDLVSAIREAKAADARSEGRDAEPL